MCIGAAVLGDALTGTALAVLLSDARSLYLWPSPATIAPSVTHPTFYVGKCVPVLLWQDEDHMQADNALMSSVEKLLWQLADR